MKLPHFIRRHFSILAFVTFTITCLSVTLPLFAGTGTRQLTCTPSSLPFGSVPTGQTQTQVLVLANSGQTNVIVSAINLSGSEFSLPNLTLPLPVAAGQSVAIEVSFSPTAVGLIQGGGTITSNASNANLALRLRGTGAKGNGVVASPSNIAFGQVAVGKSSTLPVVLTNARSGKVAISALTTIGNGFSVSGVTTPFTLDGGQSVTLNLTFTPPST